MSTLKIREYSSLPNVGGIGQMAQEGGAVVNQTVSFTSSSVQSNAFGASTSYIGMKADVAFCYSVNGNPTATTTMIDQAANEILYIGVSPGLKIAVIAAV
jgi:hypothetical protein